jgi:hypothetical protein
MSDPAKEVVPFRDKVNPTVKNVEYWMGDIEREMKAAVHFEMLKSVNEYDQMDRIKWILSHVG